MPAASAPSTVHLPPGPWTTVLDALCAQFPAITRAQWRGRFARGRVLDRHGQPLAADAPSRPGLCVRYFREVVAEPRIPCSERILHLDDHLLVADKPHFLPVAPAGRFVRETLLTRLIERTGNPDLVPLHRIDRATAGLVLFSVRRDSRAAYQSLFPQRRIAKHYQALAPALPDMEFPQERRTRIERGEPFFRMREVAGAANSETRIAVLEHGDTVWRYALMPVTGRKHQLRVHMAALGAPILGDRSYPKLLPEADDDHAHPLRLLAHSLAFTDPIDDTQRAFTSEFNLEPPCGA